MRAGLPFSGLFFGLALSGFARAAGTAGLVPRWLAIGEKGFDRSGNRSARTGALAVGPLSVKSWNHGAGRSRFRDRPADGQR